MKLVDIPVNKVLDRSEFFFELLEAPETMEEARKYDKSYFAFLRYFSERNEITEQDLIIAANFTYGWMPTILSFKSDEFSKSVDILNEVKKGKIPKKEEFEVLKRLINNSLVGVSKLLHFIRPETFPIWDSRVCNFLTGKTSKYYIEKIESYEDYRLLCTKVIEDEHFDEIYEKYAAIFSGNKVTKIRFVEQLMFVTKSNK